MPQGSLVSVIDDDDSLRDALIGLVRSLGHRASGFRSADDFLAVNGQNGADCIVTDIHMPGLSGIELVQRLVQEGCSRPVILITARGEPGLHEKAAASGAYCVLTKPFAAEALITCLEKALVDHARPG